MQKYLQQQPIIYKTNFWNSNDNLAVRFCLSHLLMNYCFLGVIRKAHAASSKRSILGFYKNLSIIDVHTTLYQLRYCLSFLVLLFSTSPSKALLVESGEKSERFVEDVSSRLLNFKHDFILGT